MNSIVNTNNANKMQIMWNIPKVSINEISKCMNIYNSTHGMFAGVPIICKGEDCSYKDVCLIDASKRIKGSRCPMEAAAVITRFQHWCNHFDIDIDNGYLKPEDAVDASLIRDLVDNEVQMLRADNKIALSGDFIGLTIAHVDNKGREHLEDTITPAEEFKFQLQDKRYKILQLLNSTRKDKAGIAKGDDPSSKAATLLNKVNKLVDQNELDNIDNVDLNIIEAEINEEETEVEETEVETTEVETKDKENKETKENENNNNVKKEDIDNVISDLDDIDLDSIDF